METEDSITLKLNDGIILSTEKFQEISAKIDQLFLRSTHLSVIATTDFNKLILKKSIDYMYTRDLEKLSPHLDVLSSIGFTWPELSVHFDSFEEPKVLKILDFAQKEGLLSKDFIDRIFVCNGCNAGFIHYHETCPTCKSRNIDSEDLVHHFPCAYVGPASDFKRAETNSFICPKCNKNLRHIGLDYEKPSVICHCNACGKNFQDTFILAKCLNCKKEVEVEYLIPKDICNYTLTKKGKFIATSDLSFSIEPAVEMDGVFSLPLYKKLLTHQIERIKGTSGINSFIVLVNLHNIEDLYRKVGQQFNERILTSIVQIIGECLKPSDIISADPPFIIYICLNDYENANINPLMKLTIAKLMALIKDNFGVSNQKITYNYKQLSEEQNIENVLLQLNKEM
jgi:predicted Zn-ribbon and HTH transcriptional regulator